jgi:anti-sigma B factor antagonist
MLLDNQIKTLEGSNIMSEKLNIEQEEKNGITILRLECTIDNELDFERTVKLRYELHELLKQGKHNIALDMSKIEIICSYTVGVFVAFERDARDRRGNIKFFNLQSRVNNIFNATRINHIVDVFTTEEEAIKSFEEK